MCWLPLARLLCYTQQQVETSMLSLLSLPVHCLMCLHLPTHVLVVGSAHITVTSQKLIFQVRFSPTPSEACCTVNADLTVVGLCPLTCKLTSCLGFSVFLLLLERWQKFRGAHLVRFLVILGVLDCVMFASHFCNLFVFLLIVFVGSVETEELQVDGDTAINDSCYDWLEGFEPSKDFKVERVEYRGLKVAPWVTTFKEVEANTHWILSAELLMISELMTKSAWSKYPLVSFSPCECTFYSTYFQVFAIQYKLKSNLQRELGGKIGSLSNFLDPFCVHYLWSLAL